MQILCENNKNNDNNNEICKAPISRILFLRVLNTITQEEKPTKTLS